MTSDPATESIFTLTRMAASMTTSDSSAPDEGEATNASTDDTTDEAEKTILDRLVDVLWILPW